MLIEFFLVTLQRIFGKAEAFEVVKALIKALERQKDVNDATTN